MNEKTVPGSLRTVMLGSGWVASSAEAPSPRLAPRLPTRIDSDPRRVFERFVDLMYRRRMVRAAFEACVAPRGFQDHEPEARHSRGATMRRLAPKLGDDCLELKVLHTALDGDIGMVHLWVKDWRQPDVPPIRRVELFRIAEGWIVEHWSAVSPAGVAASAVPAGREPVAC